MLNDDERRRTSGELKSNLALSGLSPADVAADLDFTPERLRSALEIDAADPVDVWLLRDYLEQAVRDAGATLIPFTVLTARSRLRARLWFSLQKPPRHDIRTP